MLTKTSPYSMQLFGFVGGALMLGATGCALHGFYMVWAVARHWGIAIAWPSAVPTLVLALELGVSGLQVRRPFPAVNSAPFS